jgi:hypothetical protein
VRSDCSIITALGKAGVPCNVLDSGLVAMGVVNDDESALVFLVTGATSAPNPLALPGARVPFFLDMRRIVTDDDDADADADADADDDADTERPGRGRFGWNAWVLLLATTTSTKSRAPMEDFIIFAYYIYIYEYCNVISKSVRSAQTASSFIIYR